MTPGRGSFYPGGGGGGVIIQGFEEPLQLDFSNQSDKLYCFTRLKTQEWIQDLKWGGGGGVHEMRVR